MFATLSRHCRFLVPTIFVMALSFGLAPAYAAKKKAITVAVLYFDYDGTTADMGNLRKGLAQMLVSDLSDVAGITIVERARLEQVIQELKLSRSAKFDRKTANRVGKLLGARYLVMGGFFDFGKTLRIDARIVDVETGKIVGTFGDNSFVEEFLKLEQALADSLGKSLAGLPSTRAANRNRKRKKRKGPTKLAAATVAKYGAALDALDSGNKKLAKIQLEKVLKSAPQFKLAAADLAGLAK